VGVPRSTRLHMASQAACCTGICDPHYYYCCTCGRLWQSIRSAYAVLRCGLCRLYSYMLLAQQRAAHQVHDPLLRWVEQMLGWRMVTSDSIYGPTQSTATVDAVRHMLQGVCNSA
jgi:hypothetical protein